MNTYIYGLIDPITNEIRYIGKSNNPQKRYPQHINEAKLNNTKKSNWIKKLLREYKRPELFIIDEVSKNNWQFWEEHYISLFKSWGFNLTNQTKGGGADYEYFLNKPQSEETKQKKSLSLKNWWDENKNSAFRLEANKKISETVKAQSKAKWTDELRAKCSVINKTAAINKKRVGVFYWKENGLQHNQFKAFAKYNLKGELVKEYLTVESIINDFGKNIAVTGSCKYHEIKKGFIFRYIKGNETDLPNTTESVKESIDLYLKRKENRKNFMQHVQKLRWDNE
jgi:hypothetical protein